MTENELSALKTETEENDAAMDAILARLGKNTDPMAIYRIASWEDIGPVAESIGEKRCNDFSFMAITRKKQILRLSVKYTKLYKNDRFVGYEADILPADRYLVNYPFSRPVWMD